MSGSLNTFHVTATGSRPASPELSSVSDAASGTYERLLYARQIEESEFEKKTERCRVVDSCFATGELERAQIWQRQQRFDKCPLHWHHTALFITLHEYDMHRVQMSEVCRAVTSSSDAMKLLGLSRPATSTVSFNSRTSEKAFGKGGSGIEVGGICLVPYILSLTNQPSSSAPCGRCTTQFS